jgi:hypothetical protein
MLSALAGCAVIKTAPNITAPKPAWVIFFILISCFLVVPLSNDQLVEHNDMCTDNLSTAACATSRFNHRHHHLDASGDDRRCANKNRN